MANEQNLTHPPFTSSEQHREIARRGGSKSTPLKRYAAKIREMKKKGDIDTKWFVAKLEDPECMAIDILKSLDDLEAMAKRNNNFGMIKEVSRLKLEFMRIHHGEKKKIEMTGMGNITFVVNKPEGKLPDIDFQKDRIIDAEFTEKNESPSDTNSE